MDSQIGYCVQYKDNNHLVLWSMADTKKESIKIYMEKRFNNSFCRWRALNKVLRCVKVEINVLTK